LALEGGTGMFSRKVGKVLPLYAA